MEEKQTEYKLSMATLNGIILALIGILVFVTPLTTKIAANQVKAVYIAGAVLALGGLAAVAWGLFRKK